MRRLADAAEDNGELRAEELAVIGAALRDLRGKELAEAMKTKIREKDASLTGNMQAQGTTPRRLTDLLGSLSDLVSGSGDRGTPVVLIQGYFTNFATD